MAFASVISSNGGSEGNSTAPSFTLPTPINAGNLILVFAGTDNTATFTVPSGYTAISQQDATEFQVSVFGKIADGTEDSTTVDGTLSATESSCYIALCVQDWSGNLSNVEVGAIAQSQTAEAVNPSGVTASWGADDNLFIAVAVADFWNETATGFPTGFTDNQLTQQHVNQFGGTQAVSLASKDSTSATEDPDQFTYAATPGNWAAFTAVIKPAAASGPTLSSVPATAYPGQSRTVTGSGFGPTQGTGGATVGGVAQTITAWSDTSITFTTVQGNNKYEAGKTLEVTTDSAATVSDTIELVADTASGFGYVNMSSPNTTDESSVAFNTTPTVVTGDQFEWEDFNSLGNLTVDAQGFVSNVDTAGAFRGRFWDATDSTWGSWTELNAAVPVVDETAPTVSSVAVPSAGDNIAVQMSESMQVGAGGAGGWTINLAGVSVSSAAVDGVDDTIVNLTPSRTLTTADTPTISYTQPGNGFQDQADTPNDLATLSGQAVTNNSTQTAPEPPASGRIRVKSLSMSGRMRIRL